MKSKIELQKETIELIESWIKNGKPLGLSYPQHILDLYEQEVKKYSGPDISEKELYSNLEFENKILKEEISRLEGMFNTEIRWKKMRDHIANKYM
jgi:uncharacterized small protein (DUF1192 family)